MAMTFLQLAAKLVEKCGMSGSGPTTVIGQTGELKRAINWVNEAYNEIQNLRPNWKWMRGSVSFTTIAHQATYTPAQCGITDLGEWDLRSDQNTFRCYPTSTGTSSEVFMSYLDYDTWRDYYQYGSLRTTYGRPLFVAVTPSQGLGLGLVPDTTGYTIVGDYFKAPSDLTLDADVPLLPAKFHMMIVYRAMQLYADYEGAQEVMSGAQREYRAMLRRLNRDQLPEITVG